MYTLKKTIIFSALLFIVSLSDSPQTFVKKKKGGPSVTECCDLGVDVLAQSADIFADMGKLQQRLIKISRDIIDNDKKCYLASASKEQLKIYYDKTEQCKDMLEQLHLQIVSYTEYIKTVE